VTMQFSGSRWWKVDLHAHTPASMCSVWHTAGIKLQPEDWLRQYMSAGVDCVAVTDHNTGEWIDPLKQAYSQMKAEGATGFRELSLFPGVELTVNGGIHVLAVFDCDADASSIHALLGAVGYNGTFGSSDACSRKSLVEVIEEIAKRGALAIPAHVDDKKGLLQVKVTEEGKDSHESVLDPTTLRQALNSPAILAIEVVDRTRAKPDLFHQAKRGWPAVVGTDWHGEGGAGKPPGSRFTWIKMARPSLDGLRLALLDGEIFSVLRHDEVPGGGHPNRTPEDWIERIEISGAQVMGRCAPASLPFSPWMTALVGGRGTGKSTVVHLLRAALGREDEVSQLPNESEPRQTLRRFLTVPAKRGDVGGLTTDTAVSVKYIHRGSKYVVSWHGGRPTRVEEYQEDGTLVEAASQEVLSRFPVRIFSQGQVLALADESDALLSLLDDGAGLNELKREIEEKTSQYLSLCARVREQRQKASDRDRILARHQDTCQKISAFEQAQHAEVLKSHKKRVQQTEFIESELRRTSRLADEIDALAPQFAATKLEDGLFDDEDAAEESALAAWRSFQDAVAAASCGAAGAAKDLRKAADYLRGASIDGELGGRAREAAEAYRKLVEELEQRGVSDSAQYGPLLVERTSLEAALRALEELASATAELQREADACRSVLLKMRTRLQDERTHFLTQALGGNHFVRMKLIPFGTGAAAAESGFRSALGVTDERFRSEILDESSDPPRGCLAKLFEGVPEQYEERRVELLLRIDELQKALMATASGGEESFGGKFSGNLQRQYKAQPEALDRLMLWSPADHILVEYSPAGDGKNFRSARLGSPGQRSAAMLAFLLAYGTEPLVLDQPEDDLDNHLIYDLIVRQLRDGKRSRQIIVVTHNPNVVVNGDAELVHAMDVLNGQCVLATTGAFQDVAVREEICRVMEGGREAFDRRFHRLSEGETNGQRMY